jgi:hypothetical protein
VTPGRDDSRHYGWVFQFVPVIPPKTEIRPSTSDTPRRCAKRNGANIRLTGVCVAQRVRPIRGQRQAGMDRRAVRLKP